MNFNDIINNNSATEVTKNQTQNQKAEYMLAIGMEITNEDTGEVEFISLPQPVALDTMKKSNVFGEGDFQEKLCKGDDLLESLLDYAQKNLNPGDSQDITSLKIRLFRKKKNQRDSHKKMIFNFAVA